MSGIHVLAAPAIDPGSARVEMTLPEGLTVAEIVATALPGVSGIDRTLVRVSLVTPHSSAMVLPEYWHAVRPRPGVRVVIRLIPGKGALKAVLSIVVSIAAVALGAMFGPAVGAMLGLTGTTAAAVGTALVGLGVNLLGSLLINALIPPVKPDDERRNSYSISGWRNRFEPDGAVPVLLGQIRYAPPFAAQSWTEIVGDNQYLRALFNFGEGPLALSDFRIGDTSIAEYDEVELEVRQGLPGDAPCALYPRQIVEETVGVELTRPFPRDDQGEVIAGSSAIETPIVRTTGPDATGASVILAFPGGLARFNNDGKKQQHSVSVRIEQRLVQGDAWQEVTTLSLAAKKVESFYRQHTWQFPSRGRWQVRIIMLTNETDDSKIQQRTVWAGLQTLRPEYPLNYHRPLALVAVRIKATHQLNGALDNFTALGKRICLDWDHVSQTWISRATSNPASLMRFVLQCPANPKPATDAEIDLEQLADWHEFCRAKGLHYNRVQEQAGTTLREVLVEVATAGRASPRHDGVKWGVVIDRPSGLIIDHVNPRNSWNFSARRVYVEKPDAWICKFQDQGNDFKEAQRIIRRPGFEGDITLTETLELPGLTDAQIVYREGVRRFYEAQFRPDSFEITQDGAVRVATRGDAIMLSHDVLSRTQFAGRVRAVSGNLVEMDDLVTMVEGQTYGLRFRQFAGGGDSVGVSVVRAVQTVPGETAVLVMTGSGDAPVAGDIVHFGVMGSDSFQLVVNHIEVTQDQCTIISAVEQAPIIDTLTDAAVIPAWSSRVGVEIDENLLQPSAPRFASVRSGVSGTDESGLITYLIEPGSGVIGAASFRVAHRLGLSGGWTEATIPAANGGGQIVSYAQGNTVQMRAKAVSYAGVEGPWTTPLTLVVGVADAPIPAALDADAITVSTLLGGALIQLATGADANTTRIQLYRSTDPTLDRETDAAGATNAVTPMQSFSFALGDITRSNLISGGSMNAPGTWTLDAGWAIAGGVATHTAGSAGAISQPLTVEAGKWYRVGFTVSGRAAGSVTPRLTGGSTMDGTAVSANGDHSDRLQAVTGNTAIAFAASSTFDGDMDDAVAYLETAACLPQGMHYIWIEPQNADGVPGPITGPFTVDII